MPGSGDSVQALKAGIMEIPDVIAINKMDHPGGEDDAERGALDPRRSTATAPGSRRSSSPRRRAARTSPSSGRRSRSTARISSQTGALEERRRENLAGEVFAVASARAKAHLERAVADDPELRRLLDEVQRRELDPLTAVREIMEKVFQLGDTTVAPTLADIEEARASASRASRA